MSPVFATSTCGPNSQYLPCPFQRKVYHARIWMDESSSICSVLSKARRNAQNMNLVFALAFLKHGVLREIWIPVSVLSFLKYGVSLSTLKQIAIRLVVIYSLISTEYRPTLDSCPTHSLENMFVLYRCLIHLGFWPDNLGREVILK